MSHRDEHEVRPEALLSFIESNVFRADWRHAGLADGDLWSLQMDIMDRPKAGQVISGTGGLRKLRFSPPGSNRGKSGSYRVCYVYFEDHGVVFLVTAYRKNQKDRIAPAEKKAIRELIARQERLLNERGPIK